MSDGRFESLSKPQLLRNAILESIQKGEFKPGDKLPSEPEFILQFGVSRATVREALISLEQEGWLRRFQGRGTFVSERPKVHRTLAVIAPYLYASDSPRFLAGTDVMPLVMQSIEHHARKKGMSIMLFLDNLEVATERENLLNVIERGVDAVLINYIGGEENLDCLAKIQSSEIPLVLFDRYVEEIQADSVASDNYRGAYIGVQRLLEGGMPSVAYITAPVDSTTLRDRRQGYIDAMAACGLERNVLELVQSVEDGCDEVNRDLTHRVLKRLEFPTAIFSADATRLSVIWEQLLEMDIPAGTFSLGCFDEPYIGFPEEVHFVKVLQPLHAIGRQAIDLVAAAIENRLSGTTSAPSRVLLAPEVVESGLVSADAGLSGQNGKY